MAQRRRIMGNADSVTMIVTEAQLAEIVRFWLENWAFQSRDVSQYTHVTMNAVKATPDGLFSFTFYDGYRNDAS